MATKKKAQARKAGDIIGTFVDNPFTVNTLQPKTNYDVSIKVTDKVGKFSVSDPVTFKTLPPSPIITLFTVTGIAPLQTTVDVRYKITAEGVFDKVKVYANGVYVGVSTTSTPNPDGSFSIIIGSLDVDTSYSFYIEAYDKTGQFTKSAIIVYRTYPTPPVINSVDITKTTQTSISFQINAISQTGGFSKYNYKVNSLPVVDFLTNTTTIASLTRNTLYTFTFTAFDGRGQASDPFVIQAKTYPLAPVIQSTVVKDITTTSGNIVTTATSEGGIKRYIINYEGLSVSSLTNSYVIDELAPYTSYTISVDVEDIFGQVTKGANVTFKTKPFPMDFKSYTISNIIENGVTAEVEILGTNGFPILAPLTKVDFYNASNVRLFGNVGAEYVFFLGDLMPGTTYSIAKVIATDEADQTATNTTPTSFTTIASELTLTSIVVTNITTNSAHVFLDYSAQANISKFRYKLGTGAYIEVPAEYFDITGLSPNTTYQLTVSIVDIFKQEVTKVVSFKTLQLFRAVQFLTDGGTELESVPVANGGTINLDSYTTTKYGFTFTGWYIGTVKYAGIQTITSDVTYTAHWAVTELTVRFLDWNDTVLKTQKVLFNGGATPPADPTRTGYTFSNWSVGYLNVTVNIDTKAEYTINDYYLFFNPMGGSIAPAEQRKTVHYGIKVGTLPIPTLTGAKFIEWNTSSNPLEGGTVYTSETIFELTDNLFLYGFFDSGEVYYNYNTLQTEKTTPNGEVLGKINLSTYVESTNPPAIKEIYEDGMKVEWDWIVSGRTIKRVYNLPKGDYSFYRKYHLSGRLSNDIGHGDVDVNTGGGGFLMPSSEKLVDEAERAFVLTETTIVTITITLQKPTTVTIINPMFSTLTLHLYQVKTKFSETYKVGAVINPPTVSKIGYVFDKWCTDFNLFYSFATGTTMNVGWLNLYPKFTPAKYNLTLNSDGGTPATQNFQTTYLAPLGTLPTPVKPSYEFDGWKQKLPDGRSLLTFDNGYIWNDSASETTLYTAYAQWTRVVIKSYNIGKPTLTSVVATLYKDGTLDITGTGDTITTTFETQPWVNDKALIKSVVFASTVKSLDLSYYFFDCTNLVSVTLPSTVTNMNSTFSGCTSLVNAPTIPNSVTNINYTFYQCTSLVNAPTIPSSVTALDKTFSHCTSLVNATIPNSVTSINYTFYQCTSLVNAPTIPNSVTNMDRTFSYCTSLVNATIPSSVTDMAYTFLYCTSLVNAPTIPSSVTNMDRTFSECTSLVKAPTIPSSVTIMSGAFSYCSKLTTPPPVVPSKVTTMQNTFNKCPVLTGRMLIEAKPTTATDCFLECSTGISPNNLYIDYTSTNASIIDAIIATKSPTSRILKGSRTDVVKSYNIGNPIATDVVATLYGDGLLDIVGTGNTKQFAEATDVVWANERPLIKSVTFASTVQSINLDYYFAISNLITISNIPSTVTSLDGTFNGCESLTTVSTIPAGVTSMASTFQDCTSLVTAPSIPSKAKNMRSTFAGCTALVTPPTTIPSEVADMTSTFENCGRMTSAPVINSAVLTSMSNTFEGCVRMTSAPVINSTVLTSMNNTFTSCTLLVNAPVIPNSVNNMGSTFYGCTSLVNAPAIPNSVTNMNTTFLECTSLVNAPVIPNSVTTMGSTFQECTSLKTAPVIPNSVNNMGSTFEKCTSLLTAPTIPSSVITMGYIFKGCTVLTGRMLIETNPIHYPNCFIDASTATTATLVVDYNNNSASIIDAVIATKSSTSKIVKGVNVDIAKSWNIGNPAPTSVQANLYKDGLLEIVGTGGTTSLALKDDQDWANDRASIKRITIASTVSSGNLNFYFEGCTNLVSITGIPSTVGSMVNTFYGCSSLTTVSALPSGLNNMNSCFVGCSSLTTVPTIPNFVTDVIGTFNGCTKLTTTPALPSVVTDMTNTFYGCSGLTTASPLPNGVKTLTGTFQLCTRLTAMPVIPATVNSMLNTFNGCTAMTTFRPLPVSVTNYGYTFKDCTSMTVAPAIPGNATSLPATFQGCLKLITAPVIPAGVTGMNTCFNSCSALTATPTLPEGLIDMNYCFLGCTNLATVTNIPSTVKSMVQSFNSCAKLTGIMNLRANPTTYSLCLTNCSTASTANLVVDYRNSNASIIDAFIATKSATSRITKGRNLDVVATYNIGTPTASNVIATLGTDGLLTIDGTGNTITTTSETQPWVANRLLIKNVEFTTTVKSTNLNYYFYGCSNLVTATLLPSTTTSLVFTFGLCTSFLATGLVIHTNVTDLNQTFRGCTKLVTVPTIPTSITNMNGTFEGCSALTTFQFSGIPSRVTNMTNTFVNCTSLVTAPRIDSTVLTDMSNTFRDCAKLTAIPAIPASVKSLMQTFMGCNSLTTVTNIPSTVTSLLGTFADCTKLTAVTIPTSVTDISRLFKGCTALVTAPVVPVSVTNMFEAFSGCTKLTNPPLTIPTNVTSAVGVFSGCVAMTGTIVISSLLTSYSSFFYNCSTNAGTNLKVNYTLKNASIIDAIIATKSATSKIVKGTNIDAIASWNIGMASPGAPADSNVIASLYSDGVLNITGNGDTIMVQSETGQPWYSQKSNIKSVNFSSGVSSDNLSYYFYGHTNLVSVLNIPYSTRFMASTFEGCTKLMLFERIYENVGGMENCFKGCIALNGTITIEASPMFYTNCFLNCSTNASAILKVNYTTNSNSVINNIIATKSATSHITKGSLVD